MQPSLIHTPEIDLQFGSFTGSATHRRVLTRARVARWAGLAMEQPLVLAVRVVGSAEGRALNRQYRGKDYATNVLTFSYGGSSADLVLCAPVVTREARAQRKLLMDHYAHLVVHGTLHAQGWDHETGEADALAMEAAEILLLGALGLANPY